MQHTSCPNCGFQADHNYCAECGQEIHLHKDTFSGLMMHFIGHYVHYDSKFWKTLVALWFRPGRLTLAYKEKKRARYLSPVALYVTVSAIFFLLLLVIMPGHKSLVHEFESDRLAYKPLITHDSTRIQELQARQASLNTFETYELRYLKGRFHAYTNPEAASKQVEEIVDLLPKIIFFMIPVMALLLSFFYGRKKGFNMADYTVFSLHYHSLLFSVLLLMLLNPFLYFDNVFADNFSTIFFILGMVFCLFYFIASLRRVYGIKTIRAMWNAAVLILGYFVVLMAVLRVYNFFQYISA